MADDRSKRGPADAARINVNEDYELRYWCERFGCTPDELRTTVKSAGPMVTDVEIALKKRAPAGSKR
jgi:hypothetical protein